MEYQIIKGFRRSANVVWTPEDKNLYAYTCERNGKTEYICYQKILYTKYIINKNKEKMKKKNNKKKNEKSKKSKKSKKSNKGQNDEPGGKKKVLNCTARVKIDGQGKCLRNKVNHSKHDNHESLKKDMISKNRFIDKCIEFKNVAEGLPVKVPANDIFTVELSR